MQDALPISPRPSSQDFGGSSDDCAGGLVVLGALREAATTKPRAKRGRPWPRDAASAGGNAGRLLPEVASHKLNAGRRVGPGPIFRGVRPQTARGLSAARQVLADLRATREGGRGSRIGKGRVTQVG